MRFRFTLFLLVANLAVFGLIWNNARERNRERPPSELVFPVDANRIRFAAVDAADESYELKQKSGRWNLEKPFDWPANPWTVQKILDELRFVSREQGFTIEEAQKLGNTLASYGLDKPRYTLTVSAGDADGAGKRDTVVQVGAMTPDGNAVYLLSPDGKTVLPAPKSLLAALVRKPDELRQPEVFSVQPFEVRAVTLSFTEKSGQKTGVGLVRDKREVPGRDEPDFIWRFETPVKSDADTPVVDKELAALGEMKFVRFLSATPELLEKAGFASPWMTLALDGNNRKQTLLVGDFDADSKGANRYAKFDDNPVVFTIPAEALAKWADVRREMRDHRFMRFDAGTLTGITVHEGGRSLVLHRIDAPAANGKAAPTKPEWQMPVVPGSTASVVTPVDPDELAKLESALTNLQARSMEPPRGLPAEKKFLCDAFVADDMTEAQLKELGLSKDSNYKRRVDLSFRDGTKRTLTIGGPVIPGTPYHAKLDDTPTVFSISPAILDPEAKLLSVSPSAYRRRALFVLPTGSRITSLKITDLATSKVLLDETKSDDIPAWETLLEKRPKKEREEVLALATLAGNLRAKRFIDENRTQVPYSEKYTYDEGTGLAPEGWRYKFEWTVKAASGTEVAAPVKTHTIRFTRRIGGMTQVAGSPEDNLVFALTQEWIDTLHPLTFGRDNTVDLPAMPTPAPAEAPGPVKQFEI
jgi:hypothetical protein